MLQITTALFLFTATPMPQPTTSLQDAKAAQDATAKVALPSAADSDDAALGKMSEFIKSLEIDKSQARWKTQLAQPPKLSFTEGVDYFWNLQTNKGLITIKLMPKVAPMHVSSTIFLTRAGFYDGIAFHRVIPQFMAQGGCPLGQGTGNPGYKYDGEFDPAVKHDRPGLLSMANAGPGTDGSQFFLTFVATPHLDGKHTIFGEVSEGMDVMRKLEAAGSAPAGRTTEPLMIEKASISLGRAGQGKAQGMEAEKVKVKGQGAKGKAKKTDDE